MASSYVGKADHRPPIITGEKEVYESDQKALGVLRKKELNRVIGPSRPPSYSDEYMGGTTAYTGGFMAMTGAMDRQNASQPNGGSMGRMEQPDWKRAAAPENIGRGTVLSPILPVGYIVRGSLSLIHLPFVGPKHEDYMSRAPVADKEHKAHEHLDTTPSAYANGRSPTPAHPSSNSRRGKEHKSKSK